MSKQKIDLSKLVAGDQVKTKNGKILTFQEYSNDNGRFPYIFFHKLEHYSYVKDGHYYLGTAVSPMDIVKIMKQEKHQIDLSKLKVGDRVQLRNGRVMTFQSKQSDSGDYPYIFYNTDTGLTSSFTPEGCYYTGSGQPPHALDIVEILTTPKKEFDFSSLPKNCTEIVLDGVRYEKKEKVTTTVTWEKKL